MKVRKFAMRVAVVLAVVIAMSMSAAGQGGKPAPGGPTPIKVDGKVIRSYIEWMAAPEREGRRTLTPGYEKSVEWAVAKFKEWGVKPAGENGTYLQNVPMSGTYVATTGTPEMIVDGRAFFFKDGDFAIDNRSTPGASASGEIVFVGYGISAPDKGLDEYAGVDVKGKIVLAFKGSPKDAPAARGMFGVAPPEPKSAEAWAAESTPFAKIMKAYEKGAAAILLFEPTRLASGSLMGGPAPAPAPAMVAGGITQTLDPSAFTRPFLAFTDIDVRVFRQVMLRDPQESSRGFSARIEQIRRDIKGKTARSMATGVAAQVKGYATASFYGEKYKNNISHNVLGKVEGTDPKLKNQYIVIGGHMDHLGVTNGVIYPGADDDASGTALTMEMARLLTTNAATIKPKRTIIFGLWCGEEEGLVGSNYYGTHPTDGVTMDNIVANFNGDMIGLGDGIGAPGALNFPAIFDVIMKNQDPDVAKAVHPSTGGPGGSDFSTFIERGIESLALMTDGGIGHPDYHDSGDRTDRIDAEILRKTGQFVLQGVINVANDTTTEMAIPDRLHLYNAMRMTLLNLNEVRAMMMMSMSQGVVQQVRRPGLAPALEPSAFAGNLTLIDAAAKLYGISRVDVRTDGSWFTSSNVTDRGKDAVKAFEANGMVLNAINPSATLLTDLLDNAKKPFIVSGLAAMPDAVLAKRIKEQNVLVAVDFDISDPQAVATSLMDYKKLFGDSGNLLLITRVPAPADPAASRKFNAAKQQLFLALIKAGWTKDEIYSMVGVSPRPTGPTPTPPDPGRLGGNLGKLSVPQPPTT
ncbi:MAG: M28 family peptidase [Acidobacteriia bacterium]|nr:M28 family peptidase [Terriglobia bacterium]